MSAEMKFMRRIAKYTRQDYETNENISSELNIKTAVKKVQNYRNKWIQNMFGEWTKTDCHT
jgi:hypothetical protein